MRGLLIVSHERSGTHFLMNSMAMNFSKFKPNTWRDFAAVTDEKLIKYSIDLNKDVSFIMKSHHQYKTIKNLIDYIKKRFDIVYIVRDGRDVMTSSYHHFKRQFWIKQDVTFSDFIRGNFDKSGHRFGWYDRRISSMVKRWVNHTNGWNNKAIIVKYEDLNINYQNTMIKLANKLNYQFPTYKIFEKPTIKNSFSINPRKGIVGDWVNKFSKEDLEFFNSIAGKTMEKLGYN